MTVSPSQPHQAHAAPHRDAAACLIAVMGDSIGHAGDVLALRESGHQRWTDALISETRAHLAGCFNAVQLSIGLHAGAGWLARPIDGLGPDFCRRTIDRFPALLTPSLLHHLRLRAAAALVQRSALSGRLSETGLDGEDDPALPLAVSRALDDSLAVLRLACDPWFDAHPVDQPMRPDLGAEPFCDLVWAATTMLVKGLAGQMGIEEASAIAPLGRVAEAVIAQHDEEAGPFARASQVAMRAETAETQRMLAQRAAMSRDLLLFSALSGRQCGISTELALTLLIEGDATSQASLAHAVGLSVQGFATLIGGMGLVRGDCGDDSLADSVALYRTLAPDDAAARVACWQGPEPLIARLAHTGLC